MKKSLILLFFTLSTFTLLYGQDVEIGSELPHHDLMLTHYNGDKSSLIDFKGEKGLLIVFAANECMAIEKWYDRLVEANTLAHANGIHVVWVNSNQTQREKGESLKDMEIFAKTNELPFDYVMEEKFILADALYANVTPTSYLFNKDLKLVYKGIVDDNMMDAKAVSESYLMDAINSLIQGTKIKKELVNGRGCRIPRS